MLFAGAYERTIDEKGRLQIPSAFRAVMESNNWGRALYLVRGTRRTIMSLYPAPEFERLAPEAPPSLNLPEAIEDFNSMFFSRSWPLEMDAQNRILVPELALRQAGMGREIMLLGVLRRMELWNRAEYLAADEGSLSNWEEMRRKSREAEREMRSERRNDEL